MADGFLEAISNILKERQDNLDNQQKATPVPIVTALYKSQISTAGPEQQTLQQQDSGLGPLTPAELNGVMKGTHQHASPQPAQPSTVHLSSVEDANQEEEQQAPRL